MHMQFGWAGMTLFLLGYALVSSKRLNSAGVGFNAINVAGALAIAYSLLPLRAWPTIALEGCFVLIGVVAIGRIAFQTWQERYIRRHKTMTDDTRFGIAVGVGATVALLGLPFAVLSGLADDPGYKHTSYLLPVVGPVIGVVIFVRLGRFK